MSTPSPNTRKAFRTNSNKKSSTGTLAIRTQDIHLAPPAAAEGAMNQSHTAALLSAPKPRLEVPSFDPQIPSNAIPDREIELISLTEDLKMLTNKLADLKASHKLFGTGEDMTFARLMM